MRVAFLGLGRMGRAMAQHVVDGGHELSVWNRTPDKAGDLVAAGAREAASVEDAVRDAEVVVLMLFGPDSCGGVLDLVGKAAPAGTLVIDSTTNGKPGALALAAVADSLGLRYVEAPVVGTVGPAAAGTLGVFAGGSEADYAAAEPILTLWGDPAKVRRIGEIGAGNALKTVVNATLGIAIAGVGECLRLGHDLGLDRPLLLDTLAQSQLGGIVGYKRAMLDSEEYGDVAFSLDALVKDLGLALDSAHRELPVIAAVAGLAEEAVTAGHGTDDFAALAGYVADEGHVNSY